MHKKHPELNMENAGQQPVPEIVENAHGIHPDDKSGPDRVKEEDEARLAEKRAKQKPRNTPPRIRKPKPENPDQFVIETPEETPEEK